MTSLSRHDNLFTADSIVDRARDDLRSCRAVFVGSICSRSRQFVQLPLKWESLPPIPDPNGFASPFAGVSYGALIVAGGSNFPDKKPWEGGTKVWYDSVFALDKPDRQMWSGSENCRDRSRAVFPLQQQVESRASAAATPTECYADCFLLELQEGED